MSTIDDFEANRKLYFGYNASNERLWKRNESTIISINASDLPSVETLYLHGGNPWPLVEIETVETQAQTSGSVTQTTTTTWHIYGMNGLVATHTNDKTIEFPLTDHLGSPRVVLKQDIVNGSVTKLKEVGTYSWHPFGGILQTLGNGEPQYGFTGQEKDYESDLHNFRARQYSDNLGRFFAVDPQGQYHSPYVYGGNNPFLYTDPDGEFAHLIIGAAIGGTINWLANGADFSLKGFGHFAVGAAAGAIGAGFGAGVTSMIYKGTFSAGFIGGTNGMVISGFAAGAQVGAAAGASSGFITGIGNSLVKGNTFGNSFGAGLGSGVAGGLSGGLFGGLGGAWTAHSRGQTLWGGETLMPERTFGPVSVDAIGVPRSFSNLNIRAAEVAKQFHWEFEAREIFVYAKRYSFTEQLLLDAKDYIGKVQYSAYCSDFIRVLFNKQNIRLPINHANDFEHINGFRVVDDPMPGDIVQWDRGTGGAPNSGHVAVYEGGGSIISTRGTQENPKAIFRWTVEKWTNQTYYNEVLKKRVRLYQDGSYAQKYLRWIGN